MDALRLQFKLEQHKRGISSTAGNKAKKLKKENQSEKVKTESLEESTEESEVVGVNSTIPKGFFDDATQQTEVEQKLVESMVKTGEEVNEKEWDNFEKFANSIQTTTDGKVTLLSSANLTKDESGPADVESNNTKPNALKEAKTEDSRKDEEKKDEEEILEVIEDPEMDHYADRFINIVKKSLNKDEKKIVENPGVEVNTLQEMETKIKLGANRRKEKAPDKPMVLPPW